MSKQAVIDILNEVRKAELTALSQYMAHYYYFDDLGFPKLAEESKKESIDEMKHAELLAERILDLDGKPEFRPLKSPHKNGTVEEMMRADLALEEDAIKRLNEGVKICLEGDDATSRHMLEEITLNEETHLYALKQHLDHLKKFGNDYLLQFTGDKV